MRVANGARIDNRRSCRPSPLPLFARFASRHNLRCRCEVMDAWRCATPVPAASRAIMKQPTRVSHEMFVGRRSPPIVTHLARLTAAVRRRQLNLRASLALVSPNARVKTNCLSRLLFCQSRSTHWFPRSAGAWAERPNWAAVSPTAAADRAGSNRAANRACITRSSASTVSAGDRAVRALSDQSLVIRRSRGFTPPVS